MQLLQKLKSRWEITSNWQILVILFVFACTGFTALYARRFVFYILGIIESDPFWLKALVWLVTIFPLYNIFLLAYGTLFGQFEFFWAFFKKTIYRMIPGKSGSGV